MSQLILTTDLVANYTLAEWSVYALFIHTANRDAEVEWQHGAYKFGSSIDVRRRNRATIQDTSTGVLSIRDIQEEVEQIVINHQYGDFFSFTNKSLTLEVDEFYKRYVKPTIDTMVTRQDTDVAKSAEFELSYFTGTAGTPLSSYSSLAFITEKMQQIGLEHESEKYLAVTTTDAATLRSTFANFFNSSLNKRIIDSARLGHIDGMDIIASTAIPRHIAGAPGAGPITVSVAVGAGNLITMTGFTTPIGELVFTRGDIFSIADVKGVNPLRQDATNFDMEFIVTADVVSGGTGTETVPILAAGAPIISDVSNANRNVSNSIQIGSVVTTIGDHNVNICYIPRALSLVAPPLEPLLTVQSSVVSDSEVNASIRMSANGDLTAGVNGYRLEMLSGNKWHPQYAIRVIS